MLLGTIAAAAICAGPASAAAIEVSITSPTDGAHSLGGTVPVDVNASAFSGVSSVQLYVDGQATGNPDVTPTGQYAYEIDWDTSGVSTGNHTLTALATDWSAPFPPGNTQFSAPVTVDVGPAYPKITLTAPQAYSFVNGATQIAAAVTSADDPSTEQLAVDGNTIPSSTSGSSVTATWDTTTVSDGSHTLSASITDSRSKSDSASESITVDNTPPTTSILSPVAGGFAIDTLAAQAHASDAFGVRNVQFEIDGSPAGNAVANPDVAGGFTYSATLSLSGLSGASHTLSSVATDNAGNVTTSAGVAFTIGYAPPTATVTAPVTGGFARGTVAVAVAVAGGAPPNSVQLLVDGKPSGSPQTSGYAFSWNTIGLVDGTHSVSAVDTDAQGRKSTSATVSETVDNTGPTTYVMAPAAGTFFLATMPVQAHASDSYGVQSVQFDIDGVPVGSPLSAPDAAGGFTYSATLAIAPLANGKHVLTDVATDGAGNVTTSLPVSFNVGAGPPTVAITSPANATFAAKTVVITATITGGSAPFTGKLLVDGAATATLPTIVGSSMTFQWNTAGLADGKHTVAVSVSDASTFSSTSQVETLTVDNLKPTAVMYLPTPLPGFTYARDNGPVTFEVHASDANGVASVQFTVDGLPVGALVTQPISAGSYLYSVSFDTSTLPAGMHTVSADVTDHAGNVTSAPPLSVKSGPLVYVPVLNYHGIEGPLDTEPDIYDVTAAEADSQLSYLKANGYSSITISQYKTWISSGTLPSGVTKPVLITVDDGLTDEIAWDALLQKYGFTAILYVVTGFADNTTPGANDPKGNMSWAQIQAFAANGRWQIGFHAGLDGHGDFSSAATKIKLSATQTESFTPTCFQYYNCLGKIATTTTTGTGLTKKTTTTTAAETPSQFESQVAAEVTAGMTELKAKVPTADMSSWACPWNACGQWTTFYNDASGTVQGWMPGYFASLFPIVFMQTDPITYGAASGTVGSLNADNRHYRFEVHTDTTAALFAAALTDPGFANN